jgi:hypothetical protein
MTDRNKHIGVVIAERRLHVRGAPHRIVSVSLGKPRKTKGSDDWECPFQIAGAGTRVAEYGRGIDAFQALTTALEGIRHCLDRVDTPLAWSGVFDDHTGFQRLIPLLPEAAGMRRMERLIDREAQRRLSVLKRRHNARTRHAKQRQPHTKNA